MTDIMELDDTKDLVRDVHSKALITINHQKLKEHNARRDAIKLAIKNSEDIQVLNNDISEIKSLLQILINR